MTDITIIADPEHDKKAAADAARKANLAKGRATAAANRAARKAKTTAASPPPKAAAAPSDLAGLTPLHCCDACVPTRCVISCAGICAHPAKGGLQANLQNEKTLRLFNAAKKIIAGFKLKIDE